MKDLAKKISGRSALLVLLALLAVVVMGSTTQKPRMSDLNASALQMAQESQSNISSQSQKLAKHNPGALLRANAICK